MTDQTKNSPQAMSEDEVVELAKAEEEAGVVDQQTVASAALIQEDRRSEEDS
jgi:hypothetical protein